MQAFYWAAFLSHFQFNALLIKYNILIYKMIILTIYCILLYT